MDEQIRPFRTPVDEADRQDLRDRLKLTRWADESPAEGRERGIRQAELRELAEYWQTSYDERERDASASGIPQFETEIDGQRIHFLHARSSRPDAPVLLLTHGYPSSNVEFTRLIALLTEPETGPAFHVVAPSLPGYGYSTPLAGAGWTMARIARAWVELMARLGYDRYGLHGGDIGAGVAGFVATVDAEHVTGLHVATDPDTAAHTATFIPGMADALDPSDPVDQLILERMRAFTSDGSGYLAIQNTRPQTIGYGLTDSPAFLLAWIVEKIQDWTAVDVDRDVMLDVVSAAWFGRAGASAAHVLYDQAHAHDWGGAVTVPQAVVVFGADPTVRKVLRPAAETRWTEFAEGGHFPAMELPDVLASDLQAFFGELR